MANTNNENKNVVPVSNSVKSVKTATKIKNVNKKQKPKKSSKKIVKETVSELKKVSWPTFPKVVKQTGVVLTVVIVFTLVLFGFDRLFSWLYTLLLP